jgi:hypothetical protein
LLFFERYGATRRVKPARGAVLAVASADASIVSNGYAGAMKLGSVLRSRTGREHH